MPAPAVGSVVNGYTYLGGDPNSKDAWREASVGDASRDRSRGTALGKESGAFTVGSADAVTQANAMSQEADSVMGAVRRQGTGSLAKPALWLARTVGLDKKARDLGGIERAAGSQILANAKNLKGALSDKDVAFLNSLAYNLGHSSGENTDVARVEQWAAAKAKGYAAARSAWENRLGSADTRNAGGANFFDWWGQYAEQRYPRPDFGQNGRYQPRAVTPQKPGVQVQIPAAPAPAPATTASGATVSNW